MLRRIGLSNFKCWRELDIKLAPITLLFGTNSSGKTAILQSLLMLKQTARGFDPGQHINFGGGERDYVDLGSYQDLVYSQDQSKDIAASLTWEKAGAILARDLMSWADDPEDLVDEGLFIRYEVDWRMRSGIYINKLAYSTIEDGQTTDSYRFAHKEDGSYSLSMPGCESDFEQGAFPPPQSCHILPSHKSWSDLSYAMEFSLLMDCLNYLRPLRAVFNRQYLWTGGKPTLVDPDGANSIDFLISSVRDDRQLLGEVEDQLRALDVVEAFNVKSIDQNERLYEATATIAGVESSLVDLGFGVSQVLPVVTMLLSAPEGSIILLEQPELHLHPNAQAAMADLMLEVAEKRNLQLIVESHSEHIVRRLQRRIAEADSEFAKPDNIKMYYCQPGEGGATIDEVDVDRFGQIANWPERFMGDISGDLHNMVKAALARRRTELENA